MNLIWKPYMESPVLETFCDIFLRMISHRSIKYAG